MMKGRCRAAVKTHENTHQGLVRIKYISLTLPWCLESSNHKGFVGDFVV